RVVDAGTGSGAIAIAIAHEVAHVNALSSGGAQRRGGASRAAAIRPYPARVDVVALDTSSHALDVARLNVARHAASGVGVRLLRADMLSALAPGPIDLVVSNPPYLSAEQVRSSLPELGYEPLGALTGGEGDGLNVIRTLIRQARRALRLGGYLV